MKKSIITSTVLAVAGVLALGLTASASQTQTATFPVTATVVANCTISASPMAFGNYTFGAASNSTSTITLTCTNTSPYNVGLNQGTATGATVTNRSMTGPGSALLHYILTKDAAFATNWGNTVGTDTVAGTGSGSVQTITVYGQAPASQTVAPGAYSDTVTATVTY